LVDRPSARVARVARQQDPVVHTRSNAPVVQTSTGDVSRRGLELATDVVPDARLVQGDMTAIPLAAGSVDAITAYHAVFHVPRDQHPGVYREFARVLRPGGRLLATLPSGRFETVRRGWMGGEMFFSSPGEAATLDALEDAGFVAVDRRTADDPLGSRTTFAFATRR
jgi:SAM-dependent methyltransferase